MKYILKGYNIFELGQRQNQEDCIFPGYQQIQDSDRLFILCDGMGGHEAGEVASETVCQTMSASVLAHCPDAEGTFTDEHFQQALSDALDALDRKDNGAEKKMGTTLTFLKLHDQGATIAHIGDSRVYHIRSGADQQTTRILFQTVDHSLVNDLVRIGDLTPEEAKTSRQKNVITRAMQPNLEHRPKADLYHTRDIRPGDYFFLCSDGMLEQMEDENLQYIFSEAGGDDRKKIDMLTKSTLQNHDNHSAILVHILEVKDPLAEAPLEEGAQAVEGSQTDAPLFEGLVEETAPQNNGSSKETSPQITSAKTTSRATVSGETASSKNAASASLPSASQKKPLPSRNVPRRDGAETQEPSAHRNVKKYLLLLIVFAFICSCAYWFFHTYMKSEVAAPEVQQEQKAEPMDDLKPETAPGPLQKGEPGDEAGKATIPVVEKVGSEPVKPKGEPVKNKAGQPEGKKS